MIDLQNVKMILFDFDDTLCIHRDHSSGEDEDYDKTVFNKNNAWSNCEPSIIMKSFLRFIMNEKKYEVGLISATCTYVHSEMKVKWVEKNYGYKIENLCVGSAQYKLREMKAICSSKGYKQSEILLIDDLWDTLEMCNDNGFQAASPMEVANYVIQNGLLR